MHYHELPRCITREHLNDDELARVIRVLKGTRRNLESLASDYRRAESEAAEDITMDAEVTDELFGILLREQRARKVDDRELGVGALLAKEEG